MGGESRNLTPFTSAPGVAYDAHVRRSRGRVPLMKKLLIILILAAIGVAVVKKVRAEA
jgi:hypothetical protein